MWRNVLVSALGNEPLLGMRLMAGHKLTIEIVPRGEVEIVPLISEFFVFQGCLATLRKCGRNDSLLRKADEFCHVLRQTPTRDLHALDSEGMVLCNPRDKEAAHPGQMEGIATDDPAVVTCRKCLACCTSTVKRKENSSSPLALDDDLPFRPALANLTDYSQESVLWQLFGGGTILTIRRINASIANFGRTTERHSILDFRFVWHGSGK